MPDLLTHSCCGYLIGRVSNFKRYLIIFLLGNILPDIFTRIPYRVVPNCIKGETWRFSQPLHTPIGIILSCLLISYFFEEIERKVIFKFLCLGGFLHLFIDLLQKNMGDSYLVLFPFSYNNLHLGLFWAEEALLAIPVLLLLILVVEIIMRKNLKNY